MVYKNAYHGLRIMGISSLKIEAGNGHRKGIMQNIKNEIVLNIANYKKYRWI